MKTKSGELVIKIVGGMTLILIGWRLAGIIGDPVFIDFLAYYDVSHAIIQGLSPYELGHLQEYNWPEAPIVYPGYAIIFLFLLNWSSLVAGYMFLTLNIILGFWLITATFVRTGLLTQHLRLTCDRAHWAYLASLLLLYCSSPFLMALRHGQCSILLAGCLFWVFFPGRAWSKAIGFAIAAVLKYSLLPLLGLALLAKRHYWFCLGSFAIFIVLSVMPWFWGHDLARLYADYTRELTGQAGTGFNTFPVSGYNMVTLNFLCYPTVVAVLKGIFLLIAVWAIWRDRMTSRFGLNFLLLLGCITLLVVYNRLYNLVFIEILLLTKINLCWQHRRYRRMVVPGLFLFLFLLPASTVFAVANQIGRMTAGTRIVFLSRFGIWENLFPVWSLLMLAITGYAIYEYVLQREDYNFAFTLPSKEKNDGKNL